MKGMVGLVGLLFMAGFGCRADYEDEPVAAKDGLSVWDPYAPEPIAGDVGALYFSLRNDGEADELVEVSVDVAGSATIHDQRGGSRPQAMVAVSGVAVPAEETTLLEPGGMHVMLTDIARAYRQGDSIRVSIRLRRRGTVEFVAPVVSYEDVARRADAGNENHRH